MISFSTHSLLLSFSLTLLISFTYINRMIIACFLYHLMQNCSGGLVEKTLLHALPMKFAATFLFPLLFVLLACCDAENVQVTIKNGALIGERLIAPNNRPVERFLGIRYGEAPVGEKRFHRARPVEERWSEAREALHWPPRCIQKLDRPILESEKSFVIQNISMSEDCLFLNVWTPKSAAEDETQLRPVIFWIHGGALLFGSSSHKLYDALSLAAQADAVVVTFNYRVSTLGFLFSDAVKGVRGNQGFWDQVLALEWVHENIRYFGGDAERLTIAGESAGSWSVSAHILSPVSRNLYRNAILMSGAVLTNRVAIDSSNATAQWLIGIRKVGCATEHDTSINDKVIRCLQELEPAKVDAIAYKIFDNPINVPPLMVVDGEFLPSLPHELLAQGNYKTDVNLLVDTVTDEASFLFYLLDNRFAQRGPAAIKLDEAKQFFFEQLSKMLTLPESVSEIPTKKISKLYFDKLNADHDGMDRFRRAVSEAFGDMLLGCPTLDFAKQAHLGGAQVYQWYYTARLGNPKMLEGDWTGTCHVDDVYPFFGHALQSPQGYTDREREIAREVINIVASFIRNGTPGDAHKEWQSYFTTEDGKHVIAPYYEIGNHYRTADNFKFNLKQTECESVWNRLAY